MKTGTKSIWLAVILLWTLIPFVSLIGTSVAETGNVGRLIPRRLTFEFYGEVFQGSGAEGGIVPRMRDSVIVSLITALIVITISLPSSYSISRWRGGFSNALFVFYFILRMLPPISLLVPWYLILSKLGLIDRYGGLILVYTAFQLPVGIWLLKGFFDTVPVELEEAAWVEGSSVAGGMLRVVIPLTANGVAVTAVFVFLYSYIEFLYASVVGRSRLLTLPPYIAGFATPWEIRYQMMLSAALISVIPTVVLFLVVQRYMVRGITMGAVK